MERIEVLEMKCESAFYAITPKDRRRSLGVLMAMAVAVASHSARANDPLVDLTLNKPSAVGVIDGDDRSCGLGAPQNVVRARLIVRNTKREVGPYVVRLPGYATANDGVEKAGEGDLLDLYRPFYVAAKPGDTIRIDLVNHLNDSDPVSAGPAGAKITNLHTHGLIVRPRPYSPCGTLGDYIFDQVDENNTASYRIDIPKRIFGAYLNAPRDEGNHASGPYPAGPYWFHSHLHGAAKFDVLSGQAGFLSVDCPSGASPSACPNSAAHLNANEEKILALQDLQVLVDSDHTPDKMTSGGPITSASPETAYFTDISQYAPGACGNVATAPNGLCFAPATGFKIASTGPVPPVPRRQGAPRTRMRFGFSP